MGTASRASPRYGCLHHPLRLGYPRQRRGPRSRIGSPEGSARHSFQHAVAWRCWTQWCRACCLQKELLPILPPMSCHGHVSVRKKLVSVRHVAGLSASLPAPSSSNYDTVARRGQRPGIVGSRTPTCVHRGLLANAGGECAWQMESPTAEDQSVAPGAVSQLSTDRAPQTTPAAPALSLSAVPPPSSRCETRA